MLASLQRFGLSTTAEPLLRLIVRKEPPRSGPVYRRNMKVKGPMGVFGYDYFAARYPEAGKLKLAGDAQYEALNFADGTRTTSQIRDALDAIYGGIALEDVEAYLAAAASIGVVERVTP